MRSPSLAASCWYRGTGTIGWPAPCASACVPATWTSTFCSAACSESVARSRRSSASGLRVGNDRRRQLGDALEQLGLQAFARLWDEQREHGRRLERLGIDEDDLLLDAERPRR